jgi:anti-anti-sigma factor
VYPGVSVADFGLTGSGGFAGAGTSLPWFEVRECDDPDGALRVMLVGEIDMGAADSVSTSLARLDTRGRPIRLDLSELRFIDCCGLRAVVSGVADARTAGLSFEVDRHLSWAVDRMVDFAGVASVLWPREAARR